MKAQSVRTLPLSDPRNSQDTTERLGADSRVLRSIPESRYGDSVDGPEVIEQEARACRLDLRVGEERTLPAFYVPPGTSGERKLRQRLVERPGVGVEVRLIVALVSGTEAESNLAPSFVGAAAGVRGQRIGSEPFE